MKHWLARDVDGSLWIYKGRKPKTNEHGFFLSESNDFTELNKEWFTEVTFENSPIKVELKLVKKE